MIRRLDDARTDPSTLDAVRPTFRYAKVKLTDNCNSRCITCDYWKTYHANELTLEEIRSVLDQLRALGVEEVMFTGGEPTMCAELAAAVRHAAALEFPMIGLTTNGLSLPGPKLDQLLDAGLTQIVLSLEGLETHDEIRGVPGNARKVLAALDHLRARRAVGASVAVKLAMTLMDRTLDEVPETLDLARRCEAVLFFNLIDRGAYFFAGMPADLMAIRDRARLDRVLDGLLALKAREPKLIGNTVSSLEYAHHYFDDPKQQAVPCHLGYIGVDVDANGDVYSNCWGLPPVGNVRRAPLADILGAESYRDRCRAMFRKECPGCSCGYILNLAYHKPAVERDARSACDPALAVVGYAGTQS